jgi:hypothetical protein
MDCGLITSFLPSSVLIMARVRLPLISSGARISWCLRFRRMPHARCAYSVWATPNGNQAIVWWPKKRTKITRMSTKNKATNIDEGCVWALR